MTAPIVEDHPAEGARSLTLRLVRSVTSDASQLPRVVVSIYAVESSAQYSPYLVRGVGRITGESERGLEAVLYERGLETLSLEAARQVAADLYAELAARCGVAT